MESPNCDFSPMKQQVKEDLRRIISQIEQSIESINKESECLLATFDQIKRHFFRIESQAASFYLMCYLSAFTDKYLDLSITLRNLSERRHGALIVVQRNDSLDHLIQPGTPVGATLTPALLESIFYPGSPLHDGAVLIQANTIVSASNILPNVQHLALGDKHGTRHRAALGVSEQSDALVLVVSEETGQASFALHGKLHPINTVDRL